LIAKIARPADSQITFFNLVLIRHHSRGSMTYRPRGQRLAHADEILALIETGMTVLDACASKPAFPSKSSFVNYCRGTPEGCARLQEAYRVRDQTAVTRGKRRRGFSEGEYDSALQAIRSSTVKNIKSILVLPLPTYQGDRPALPT
jgi:hypothetical protein